MLDSEVNQLPSPFGGRVGEGGSKQQTSNLFFIHFTA
jgi:hypothetical protein